MKKTSKLLSLLLAMLMLITALPAATVQAAVAETAAEETAPQQEVNVPIRKAESAAADKPAAVPAASPLENEYNEEGKLLLHRKGQIVRVGSYPQSKVTDPDTLAALDGLTPTWKSYNYYIGKDGWTNSMSKSNFMKYADVELNGERYRGVKFSSFRPRNTWLSATQSNSYQSQYGYQLNTVYWFRYEPLEWVVLDPQNGYVISKKILDSQAFQNEVYAIAYRTYSNGRQDIGYYRSSSNLFAADEYNDSTLRSWLTKDFFKTAFSDETQAALIKARSSVSSTKLDQMDWGWDPATTPASDKIFLCTYKSVVNFKLEDVKSCYTTKAGEYFFPSFDSRKASPTDYAQAQGLSPSNNWRLINGAGGDFRYSAMVSGYSGAVSTTQVNATDCGIRPIVYVDSVFDPLPYIDPGEITEFYTVIGGDKLFSEKTPEGVPLEMTYHPQGDPRKAGEIVWQSSDENLLSLYEPHASGNTVSTKFHAKHEGEVQVTAMLDDRTFGTVTIHVIKPVLTVETGPFYMYPNDAQFYLRGDDNTPRTELHAYLAGMIPESVVRAVKWTSPENVIVTDSGYRKQDDQTWELWCNVHSFRSIGVGHLQVELPGAVRAETEIEVCSILLLDSVYDTDIYCTDNMFFTSTGSLSDSVNIYLYLENIGNWNAQRTDVDPDKYTIEELTVTAEIDRGQWSFDRGKSTSSFTRTFTGLKINEAVDELITLFPKSGMRLSSGGQDFKVTVSVEASGKDISRSFVEEYEFSTIPLSEKTANEHIEFFGNSSYRDFKQNYYGDMAEIRNSAQYKFQSFLTFDLTNYYDVVVGDLILSMVDPSSDKDGEQKGMLSKFMGEFVDEVKLLKTYKDNYDTAISNLKKAADYNFTDEFKLSEGDIDKFLKKSEYITAPEKIKDPLRDKVLSFVADECRNDVNKVFAGIEKSQQFLTIYKEIKGAITDIKECVTKISLYESYRNADAALKTVFAHTASLMPEGRLREAAYDYVNYAADETGLMAEFMEEVIKVSVKVGMHAFKTLMGKQLFDYVKCSVFTWLGNQTTAAGVKLATLPAFAEVTGGLFTGYALGSLASDLLCKTSDDHTECAKVAAMAELSQYVADTLRYYENQVRMLKTNASVRDFEAAFVLQKGCQSYVMEHTIAALEAERDCPVRKFLKKTFNYDRGEDNVIAQILIDKRVVDELICHSPTDSAPTATRVITTKLLRVFCPVDVCVYDASGALAAEIRGGELISCAPGVEVVILNDHKFLSLPGDDSYQVEITATDDGVMRYSMSEVIADGEILREVAFDNIRLQKGLLFKGNVPQGENLPPEQYVLRCNGAAAGTQSVAEYEAVTESDTYLLGDTDADGKVTSADARLTLRASVGLENYDEGSRAFLASDADRDGKISSADARLILRASVGLEKLS